MTVRPVVHRLLHQPPLAEERPHVTEIHGDRLEDPYFWLRRKRSRAVLRYLQAENRYTARMMKSTEPLQRGLFREIRSHLKETDLSVPQFHDGFFYYTRMVKGRQYAIHCRRRGSMEAEEEVILDVNELARGKKFMSVGEMAVTDDGHLLAYSTDETGFRDYTLRVKDLRTGKLLATCIHKVGDAEWAGDNRTLFYTVEDDAKRSYRLYRHDVFSGEPDVLIREEKDERFGVAVERSRSRDWLFLILESHTTAEVHCLPADRPTGRWRIIAPREQDHDYSVDHHGEYFYIHSNQAGRNYALFRVPITNPERSGWKVVVPHRSDVMLEGADFFENFYVLSELEDALPHLKIVEFRTGRSARLKFHEAAYSVHLLANPEFKTDRIRYGYQSMTTPNSVFECDWKSRKSVLLKRTEVLGGFRPEDYVTERIRAKAEDGRRVPISLVYHKSVQRNGKAPLLMTGYGAYGVSSTPYFSAARLSLLNRGVVFAIAHVRGGGDLGKPWHDEGRMRQKRNTFTDFIACAEHLIARRYTSPKRLAIEGGSAGGLLIGAVLNLRPDLFHAAVLNVPFVDVLQTMLDESLPLTVGEFEEWGNPKVLEDYRYMKSYCPYTNLKPGHYPAILIHTSLNDSQVMYWEPAKYAARLRRIKKDSRPLLLRVNMTAGHGGASGRYDHLRETAFEYAFLLKEWGLERVSPRPPSKI